MQLGRGSGLVGDSEQYYDNVTCIKKCAITLFIENCINSAMQPNRQVTQYHIHTYTRKDDAKRRGIPVRRGI